MPVAVRGKSTGQATLHTFPSVNDEGCFYTQMMHSRKGCFIRTQKTRFLRKSQVYLEIVASAKDISLNKAELPTEVEGSVWQTPFSRRVMVLLFGHSLPRLSCYLGGHAWNCASSPPRVMLYPVPYGHLRVKLYPYSPPGVHIIMHHQ